VTFLVFSIIILAVSLSIDALFVGFAYGLEGTKIPAVSKLIICLFSCLYAGIAIFAGGAISHFLPPLLGRLIGAVILASIGATMIIKTFFNSEKVISSDIHKETDGTVFKFIIKSLGITIQILKNPDAGDMDKSGVIDLRESVLLGSALSIDAVGVGVGSAISGLSSWYIPLAIGLCQLMFLSSGLLAGNRFTFLKQIHSRLTGIIPGLFLIALSIIRLF
jgi:putative sporulation protein YtaF